MIGCDFRDLGCFQNTGYSEALDVHKKKDFTLGHIHIFISISIIFYFFLEREHESERGAEGERETERDRERERERILSRFHTQHKAVHRAPFHDPG